MTVTYDLSEWIQQQNVSLFKGHINLMDMIKYNLVFQMDTEAPLTKHN